MSILPNASLNMTHSGVACWAMIQSLVEHCVGGITRSNPRRLIKSAWISALPIWGGKGRIKPIALPTSHAESNHLLPTTNKERQLPVNNYPLLPVTHSTASHWDIWEKTFSHITFYYWHVRSWDIDQSRCAQLINRLINHKAHRW